MFVTRRTSLEKLKCTVFQILKLPSAASNLLLANRDAFDTPDMLFAFDCSDRTREERVMSRTRPPTGRDPPTHWAGPTQALGGRVVLKNSSHS